jgi:L-iditol 2-dehydrogenase
VRDLPGGPSIGDLVTVDLRTRCGVCHACRRGRSAICLASQSRPSGLEGVISIAGALSDVIVVDADHVWPVGDVSVEQAAMGEPIACVAHSMRRGGFLAGDRVAVLGGGYMGRLHMTMARAAGAMSVGIIDVSQTRREEADTAGVHWTAAPESARAVGGECDVVFVTAGAPGSLDLALDLVAKGGSVVLYGAFPDDLAVGVHPNHMHHAETSIVGVHSHEPEDWRTAAGLIASGAIASELDDLITARFSLADVFDALQLASTKPVYRVLVGG